jgi:hypothetical protein
MTESFQHADTIQTNPSETDFEQPSLDITKTKPFKKDFLTIA